MASEEIKCEVKGNGGVSFDDKLCPVAQQPQNCCGDVIDLVNDSDDVIDLCSTSDDDDDLEFSIIRGRRIVVVDDVQGVQKNVKKDDQRRIEVDLQKQVIVNVVESSNSLITGTKRTEFKPTVQATLMETQQGSTANGTNIHVTIHLAQPTQCVPRRAPKRQRRRRRRRARNRNRWHNPMVGFDNGMHYLQGFPGQIQKRFPDHFGYNQQIYNNPFTGTPVVKSESTPGIHLPRPVAAGATPVVKTESRVPTVKKEL